MATTVVPSSASPPSPTDSGARLLLVSNRLPITIKRADDGSYSYSMSSGGLVSGLSGLSRSTVFQWYGWPGLEVPEKEIAMVTKRLKDDYNAIPVFIDDELADKHYNGFSSECCRRGPAWRLLKTCRLHLVAAIPLSPGRDCL